MLGRTVVQQIGDGHRNLLSRKGFTISRGAAPVGQRRSGLSIPFCKIGECLATHPRVFLMLHWLVRSKGKDLSILKSNVLLDPAAIDIPRYPELVEGRAMMQLYELAFGKDECACCTRYPAGGRRGASDRACPGSSPLSCAR